MTTDPFIPGSRWMVDGGEDVVIVEVEGDDITYAQYDDERGESPWTLTRTRDDFAGHWRPRPGARNTYA